MPEKVVVSAILIPSVLVIGIVVLLETAASVVVTTSASTSFNSETV